MSQVEWGKYRLGDLFEINSYKRRFDANKVYVLDKGKYPYIVRMSGNNGQKGYIVEDPEYLNDGNTISFGQDTATMYYQEQPYFTGDKIKVLKCKLNRFGRKNAHFFLTSMAQAFKGFSWGCSKFNVETIENQIIQLPVNNGKIDFNFMESFIAELEEPRYAELEAYLSVTGLKDTSLSPAEEQALRDFDKVEWRPYKMNALFYRVETKKSCYKANDLPKCPTGEYVLPCLTSSFQNQGLNYYVPIEGATVLRNVISIPSNSDVYRAYFQSRAFTVLSDAYAIKWNYPKNNISNKQYLFFVSCINKVTDLKIYSYKNKLGGWNVVQNKYIQVPVKNEEIAFDFMDNLISAIQKLVIRDVVSYSDAKLDATKHVIQKEE